MIVPTGFALVLQNPEEKFDGSTVLESAYRTPRLFGELEVDRAAMLGAASSVLLFSESIGRSEGPDVSPLGLSLAFVVPHKQLFGMMSDHRRSGPELRSSLNARIREVARTGRRHALFFSNRPLDTMREWLYHEWRRLGGPAGSGASFPMSRLLVAGILGHGTSIEALDVETWWQRWTNQGLRLELTTEGEQIIKKETSGGVPPDYSRVHFVQDPLQGNWAARHEREGRGRLPRLARSSAIEDAPATPAHDVDTPIAQEVEERPTDS
jgi:hypothetical protein